MTDMFFSRHIERLNSQISMQGIGAVAKWLPKYTKLRGQPFSYEGHEYQRKLAEDVSPEVVVRKCSQIGFSEFYVRWAIATANLIPGFSLIYTLPTAKFAAKFVRTRVDPTILQCDTAREALNPNADNVELKQFGMSFLHFGGTYGAQAAISTPADALVHDEYDFSDPEVMSNYQSRLTHSKYRIRREFSTPTVKGFGVSKQFDTSRRWWNMCKCHHCNHWFQPEYFRDVVYPGYKGELRDVNKQTLSWYDPNNAYVACPKCKKPADLMPENREWVLENPEDNYSMVGYQITPFDCPTVITPGYLIEASTKYSRYADFVNFNLGLPAEDQESALQPEEVKKLFVRQPNWGFKSHVMGVDMGLVCHLFVAGVDMYGNLYLQHAEKVPILNLESRKKELQALYRVGVTVMDAQPYVETVWRLQKNDRNLFAAMFVQKKGLQQFEVIDRAADSDTGQVAIKQVNISKNKVLDLLLEMMRTGGVQIRSSELDQEIVDQLTDMKRIKDYDANEEFIFRWVKSPEKNDHFHMALVYVWVASQMRMMAQRSSLPLFGVRTFALGGA